MVAMMNVGHSAVARWGLQFLKLAPDAKVLDCGCGGGANMKRLLKKCPQGIVKGIDYSPVSVQKARSLNRAAIQEGRCVVWQGSVEHIIFAKDWFDAVTAFETVYFWPDLPQCFREVDVYKRQPENCAKCAQPADDAAVQPEGEVSDPQPEGEAVSYTHQMCIRDRLIHHLHQFVLQSTEKQHEFIGI